MRHRGDPRRRLLIVAPALATLAATGLLFGACGAAYTPGSGAPSAGSTLLPPDKGWVSAGGAGFLPLPFEHPAERPQHGPQLIGTTGSEARVKWIADPQDARSTLVVHVVDVTDPTDRADIVFRGAGGAGSADLPIEAGKRTVYKLTFGATGTYRRCSVLIEVRTQ